MTLPANLLSASNSSSSGTNSSMDVTDDAVWYSTVQPDTVSNTTLNSTTTDLDLTMPTLSNWHLYTYCGLLGFGLISNTLNMVVISKLKTSVMYIYLQWIAFFELCFCIFLAPGVAMLRIGYTTSYVFAWLNSFIFMLMWYVASSVSMLLTVVIGYDRIYHITSPLRARAKMTKTRAWVMVAIVVVVCIVLRLPFILKLQIVSTMTSDGQVLYRGTLVGASKTSFISYMCITAFVFDYFSPISLAMSSAIILYYKGKIQKQRKTLLAVHITKGRIPAPSMQPTPIIPSYEEKLMVVLVTMSLMSITCNVPVTILRLIWPVPAQHFELKNIANLLYVINHICNVFIYTATDRIYWNQLITLLRPCRQNETTTLEQHGTANGGTFHLHENINSLTSVNTI